jgi:small subunit ribosomal protein S6
MNIECDMETLSELESSFKFSDAVLRWLTVRRDEAITEASPMAKEKQEEASSERGARGERAVPDEAGRSPVADDAEGESDTDAEAERA